VQLNNFGFETTIASDSLGTPSGTQHRLQGLGQVGGSANIDIKF